jgi:hypothetical protein
MRHTDTYSRIPLDKESARRRDHYPTGHNIHNRKTSMTPAGFEPTIAASGRPQNKVLDRAATWIGQRSTQSPRQLSEIPFLKTVFSRSHHARVFQKDSKKRTHNESSPDEHPSSLPSQSNWSLILALRMVSLEQCPQNAESVLSSPMKQNKTWTNTKRAMFNLKLV